MTNNRWRTSTYSGGDNNNCVELDVHTAQTDVRDSKNRAGGTVRLAPAAWSAFLVAVRRGSLDR
jgi:uncharacterized protein DUF397